MGKKKFLQIPFFRDISYAAVDIETPSPTYSKQFPIHTSTKTSLKDHLFLKDPVRDEVFDSLISDKSFYINSKISKSKSLHDDCSDSFIEFKSDTQDGEISKINGNNNYSDCPNNFSVNNFICNSDKQSLLKSSGAESLMGEAVNILFLNENNSIQKSNTKKTHRRPMSLDLTSNFRKTEPLPTVYLYIQMQLCQKQSLKEWLVNNKLVERQDKVLPIFEQIVDAVEYVHLQGLIHRDLKVKIIIYNLLYNNV